MSNLLDFIVGQIASVVVPESVTLVRDHIEQKKRLEKVKVGFERILQDEQRNWYYNDLSRVIMGSNLFSDIMNGYLTGQPLDNVEERINTLLVHKHIIESKHADIKGVIRKMIACMDSVMLKPSDGEEARLAYSFIEEMIQQNEYPFYSVKRFLETILTMNGKVKVQIHQDAWIKHFIEKYPQDKLRMECLFCAVAQMTEERKIEYVRCFLQHTQILDDFRVIFPMLHPTYWSGSAVPMYSKYRDYLMKLLPYLQGIKFIQHKAFIEDEIAGLQRQIEKEQLEDILKGYI